MKFFCRWQLSLIKWIQLAFVLQNITLSVGPQILGLCFFGAYSLPCDDYTVFYVLSPPHPHDLDFFLSLATMSGLSVWKPACAGGNYPAIWPSLEILVFQSGRQVGQSPCCSLKTCPWTHHFSLLSHSFLCQRDLDSNRGCIEPATCFPGPNRDEVSLAHLLFTKLMLTSGNHCVLSKCS